VSFIVIGAAAVGALVVVGIAVFVVVKTRSSSAAAVAVAARPTERATRRTLASMDAGVVYRPGQQRDVAVPVNMDADDGFTA
jgi:hypothetical protein